MGVYTGAQRARTHTRAHAHTHTRTHTRTQRGITAASALRAANT